MTDTLFTEDTLKDPFADIESDDPRAKAHYVRAGENPHIGLSIDAAPEDLIALAKASDQHLVALCGHTWKPKHDAKGKDVCEACASIAAHIIGQNL